MVGEKIGNKGGEWNDGGTNDQDAGKKVLELSVMPEGMTVEQYEDYLNGMTDRFGNPAFSASTRENLVGKYARGELAKQAVNPLEKVSAEDIEKANAAAEQDKRSEAEKILAGREASEALNSINNELKELEWARWNLEQFLASHWDKITSEGTTTYSQQLDTIKGRIQELSADKGVIEQEFGAGEKALPDMGERAAVDANEPVQHDQEKLMTAMGRMLEKWRNRRSEPEAEMLATEPGAEPDPEEFTEQTDADKRAAWLETLRNATDPKNPDAFKPGEWVSAEEKAELTAEQREALKKDVMDEVEYRAPWRRLATQGMVGLLLAGTLFGSSRMDVLAGEGEVTFGEVPTGDTGKNGAVTENDNLMQKRLGTLGVHTRTSGAEMKRAGVQRETHEVDQSFAEWALARGEEIYAGFETEEGTQIGQFGEMANYTKGWDLNKPGSNHFGPSLAVLIEEAKNQGLDPESALPGVIEGLLQNYRNQPECNMAYISKFPTLLAECGVSEDIINIEDANKRTDALIDLWHSKDGGAALQKKLIAATELTLTSEYSSMDLFQSYDKVSVDYLRLKAGKTKSGVDNMEIDQDIKQREGEWALTVSWGNGVITVFLQCGGQEGEKIKEGQKKRYNPTVVTIRYADDVSETAAEELVMIPLVAEQSIVATDMVATQEQPEVQQEEIPEEQVEEVTEVVEEPEEIEEIEEETEETKDNDEEEVVVEEDDEDEGEDDEEEGQGEDEEEGQGEDEEEEQGEADDGKTPEDAQLVLNDEKVEDGILDQTDDVGKEEVETELEEVVPDGEYREEVNDNMVEDAEGDAQEQKQIDEETNNENIETEEAEADAIAEFLNRMNGVSSEEGGE